MTDTYGLDVFDGEQDYIKHKGRAKRTHAQIMWQRAYAKIIKHRVMEGQILDGCRWVHSTPYIGPMHSRTRDSFNRCCYGPRCMYWCSTTMCTVITLFVLFWLFFGLLNWYQLPLSNGEKTCSEITWLLLGFGVGMVIISGLVWLVCRWELVFSRSVMCSTFTALAVLSIAVVSITQISTCGNYRPPQLTDECFFEDFYMTTTQEYIEAAPVSACQKDFHGLGIVEVSVLTSMVAKLEPSPYLINVTATLFPGWEWVGGSLAGSMPMWYEFHNQQSNTSYIVIQGSSTLGDAYFDLQIWFTVFWLKNILYPIIPMLSLLTSPTSVQAALSLIGTSGTFVPSYYLNVAPGIVDYVQPVATYAQHAARGNPARTVIAGHSLGGGVAQLVGSITQMPSISIEGPGVLEAQMGMLGVPWVRNNGGFNTVATGDIVPSLGSHSGTEQQIDCQGFPTIPFASCHLTIGAVFAKNCGFPPREPGHEWESLPVDPKTKAMNYCPGLISTQEGLPDSVQNSLARTRSNYFWGENAYLWNNSDFHLVGGRT